jgi:hypothetical protein
MSLYGRLRLDMRKERVEIKEVERQVEAQEEGLKIATKLPERKAS